LVRFLKSLNQHASVTLWPPGLAGFDPEKLTLIGETALSDLKIRPDYAVSRLRIDEIAAN